MGLNAEQMASLTSDIVRLVEQTITLAGQDINVLAGNIVSTKNTLLNAAGDINLLSATNTSQEAHFEKKGIRAVG